MNPNLYCGLWVIMMCQCSFIGYSKYSTVVQNVHHGRGCVWERARCLWELSVLSTQFCCEPTTALKRKTFNDLLLIFFLSFVFLGLHPRHMEIPRLGVESELQLLVHTTASTMQDSSVLCDLYHSLWQRWILNPLSRAKD